MPIAKATLKYRHENNTFIFSCPPWINDLARSIPNRRWNNNAKVWVAPALRANAQYFSDLGPDVDVTPDAKSKIQEVLERASNIKRSTFPAWFGFKVKPWKFQLDCLNFMYGQKVGGLLMDMGTGKTKCWLDIACCYRAEGKIEQALVVCPLTIHGEWIKAVNEHAAFPISVYSLDTRKKKDFERWLDTEHDFKLLLVGVESMSTGGAAGMAEAFLRRSLKNAMLVDESSNIKNHRAARTEACISLGKLCEYRHIATGTPIAHGPCDFFAQFEFLDTDIIGIGDFWSFRNRYAIMGGFEGKQIVGYQNIEELLELVKPFVFQALKKDVFPDLPPKVYTTRTVKMSKEQEDIYKHFKRKVEIEIGEQKATVKNILVRMLRLSQITAGFWVSETEELDEDGAVVNTDITVNELPNPKVSEMLRVVEESDLPTIIWSNHLYELHKVVSVLTEKYGKDQVVAMHGGVPKEERAGLVKRFQAGEARFFVGNTQTGGIGLNLFKAQIMIYMSNSYKLIDRLQSEDRAWRAGQTNRLTIIDIVTENSIDGNVLKCLESKTDVAEYVREQIKSNTPGQIW